MAFLEMTQMIQSTQEVLKRTLRENKLPTLSSRPTDSVVRTISNLLEGEAR
jgi:hypothetical protein